MPTTETFWNQVGAYNDATLPMQVIMVVVAVILTCLVFIKPSTRVNSSMKTFLAFAFAWNGIVFFLIFASSPMGIFIGAPLFIVAAILLTVDIFTKKTDFGLPKVKWQKYLMILWVLLAFLYPAIGAALGHCYPKACTPMMPCPLTVFAIALVAAAIPEVDKKLYIVLLP